MPPARRFQTSGHKGQVFFPVRDRERLNGRASNDAPPPCTERKRQG